LLYSLLSSGTASYNDATYDDLPLPISVAMQSDLVDQPSFLAASKAIVGNPLAHRTAYVIDEPISWSTLCQREAKVFGWTAVWQRGKIRCVNVLDPDVATYDVTLDESNNIEDPNNPEWPDCEQSVDTVVNQYQVEVLYDNSTGKYGPPITITDIDSEQGYRITKRASISHPGIYHGIKGSFLKSLLETELVGRTLRYSSPTVKRSLAPTLLNLVYVGDVVRFISTRVMDPDGSGLFNTNCLALVLDVSWNHQVEEDSATVRPLGTCTLMLLTQYASFGLPWAPAALVDKSQGGGGYVGGLLAADSILWLIALQWGASGDPDDGSAFNLRDKVYIIERAPSDPTAPDIYGPYEVVSAYETSGAERLTLQAGAGDAMVAAGWDGDKEHVVIFADYDEVVTAQETLATYQAATGTMTYTGGDKAQRYG